MDKYIHCKQNQNNNVLGTLAAIKRRIDQEIRPFSSNNQSANSASKLDSASAERKQKQVDGNTPDTLGHLLAGAKRDTKNTAFARREKKQVKQMKCLQIIK